MVFAMAHLAIALNVVVGCVCRTADENRCLFLRVDIVLHGATFFIVFSDADHMPPPYRIDNFSEVNICL